MRVSDVAWTQLTWDPVVGDPAQRYSVVTLRGGDTLRLDADRVLAPPFETRYVVRWWPEEDRRSWEIAWECAACRGVGPCTLPIVPLGSVAPVHWCEDDDPPTA